MKNIFQIISSVIVSILLIDAFGFLLWAWSGQIPQGDFYIGAITMRLIHLIF